MKIVQINTTCDIGSTGKICVAISELLNERNIENYILYTQGKTTNPNGIKFANDKYKKIQALKSRILGNGGFNSHYATWNLISKLDVIKPDIVHIHNIHGHDCNLKILFRYLKENKIKVFWTFHDCWAFTANCPHFTMAKCEQWMTSCQKCPQIRQTSWFLDNSYRLFQQKKNLFQELDLTIITPSYWLKDLVKKSFLKEYAIKVINNGIDLNIFKPRNSDFREKYNCSDKFIILGVAFDWGIKKGLDVFVELAETLGDEYQIVLVGTNNDIDTKLPKRIISIHRTNNQKELAQIYTAANVLINPTREENYPTVNMEALACGTPVVTYRTGGSAEIIDESCGMVVECDDRVSLKNSILHIKENAPYSKKACLAKAKQFNKDDKFLEYMKLYKVD